MAYDPNDAKDVEVMEGLVAEATKGLTTKRDQLLDEVKKLKEAARKGANDPEALARAEARIEALETELETAGASLKTATKDLTKAQKALDSESTFSRNMLIDGGLTDALVSANVAKQFLPAVKALLLPKAAIKVEGDSRKVVFGEKSLGDFITEWSQSDEGKNYVTAPANGGGGADGGAGGKNGAKTLNRAAFDALGHAERTAFAKDGGTVV